MGMRPAQERMHLARILLEARIKLSVEATEWCPILLRTFVIFAVFCANLFCCPSNLMSMRARANIGPLPTGYDKPNERGIIPKVITTCKSVKNC